ncbi:Pre-mRNA-splicing factor cwc26, partial [Bonamia ostreae]
MPIAPKILKRYSSKKKHRRKGENIVADLDEIPNHETKTDPSATKITTDNTANPKDRQITFIPMNDGSGWVNIKAEKDDSTFRQTAKNSPKIEKVAKRHDSDVSENSDVDSNSKSEIFDGPKNKTDVSSDEESELDFDAQKPKLPEKKERPRYKKSNMSRLLKEDDPDLAGMVWGKGYVQHQKEKTDKEELKKMAEKPFSRTIEDEELNLFLRNKRRWGDPMSKNKIRKKIKTGKTDRPICRYRFPNRYNIAPGYRWDGIDRSN